VLNLSIGGPDFMDHPFVDKVGVRKEKLPWPCCLYSWTCRAACLPLLLASSGSAVSPEEVHVHERNSVQVYRLLGISLGNG